MEDIPLFTFGNGQAQLCRIPDFAKAHDVPVQTLYSAVSSGRIIHVRKNGKLYMNAKSAEDFMTSYVKLTTTPKES